MTSREPPRFGMRTAVVTLSANEGIVLPLTDVVVFGANGRTGRIIVEKLLDRRHNVTAAMRNPAAFSDFRDDARHPQRLRTASVDVEDPASVLASVDGQTASTGAPRFLCVSSGGANRYDPNLGFWFRRIVIPLAGSPEALPASARDFYIELLRRTPGALKASFDYYRAIDVSIPQYRRRVARGKLTMPVLAFSGALACESCGKRVANPCGRCLLGHHPRLRHYPAEEKPQTLLEALDAFLAAYAG